MAEQDEHTAKMQRLKASVDRRIEAAQDEKGLLIVYTGAGKGKTTAALGMIQEAAKSKVPALGYGMPYAIGNTLLTIFGMVIVLMLVGGSG